MRTGRQRTIGVGLGLWLLAIGTTAAAKPLYVSPAGNDSVSYAENSEARPWRTLGRAAWGSTDRNAPNASQAAQAGDVVYVAAGTYAFTGTINNRWGVVYNPVNHRVRFVARGDVRPTAPSAGAPVIGSSGRDEVWWSGDGAGRWVVDEADIRITPDTGPVVFVNGRGGGIEDCEIDGNGAPTYNDNHPGVRVENYDDVTVRRCYIHDVRHVRGNHNGAAIMTYTTHRATIEHNRIERVDSGVFIKGAYADRDQTDPVVRWNLLSECGECIIDQDATRSRIYQNIILNGAAGLKALSRGPGSHEHPVDAIYANNTIVGMSQACLYLTSAFLERVRAVGNLTGDCTQWYAQAVPMPSAPALDVQHGLGFGAGRWLEDSTGRYDMSRLTALGHGTRAPALRQGTPGFVAAGDYRLAADSPARGQSVDVLDLDGDGDRTEVIPAGAYVTGAEVIGIGGGTAPPPPPPPPPVDCRVSDWTLSTVGPWGACTAGQQTREETWTRTVLQEPAHGGAACPALTEIRTGLQSCTAPPPPPPLGVTATGSTRTCTLVATATQPPDTTPGWGVQFSRRRAGDDTWAAHGTRDAAAPFTRSAAVPLGEWEIQAVWTRTGAAPVTVPALAVWTCEP